MEKFASLGLVHSLSALQAKGFEEPTEIQAKVIPLLLGGGVDVIAQAQTGTGKTAAFGLVFIEKLQARRTTPQAIVLAPTRELAVQVAEEISSLNKDKKLRIVPIYGGQSSMMQKKQLRSGVDIVVGTPGRVLDLIRQKALKLGDVEYFVLDEADEMLNMGFIEDIEDIMSNTPEDRQTLLFSATMPRRIEQLAKRYMREPHSIKATAGKITNNNVDQIYFEVNQRDKFEALCRIIDIEDDFYGIIFTRTKVNADRVSKHLTDRGYRAEAMHGDVSQAQRENILRNFKNKKTSILVATDVAARGIDVQNLSHVVNYSIPQNSESYVHRIGRTGRAGNSGTAITLVTPSEYRQLHSMQRSAKATMERRDIPAVDDVIRSRRTRLMESLSSHIRGEGLGAFTEVAESLLELASPADVVSALLKESFAEVLDASTYNTLGAIKGRRSPMASSGTTRLYLSRGRKDNETKETMMAAILEQTGLDASAIKQIEVFEKASFLTVTFQVAEQILQSYNAHGKGSNMKVQKAEPSGKPAGPRGGGSRGGRRPSGPRAGGRRGGGYGAGRKGGRRRPEGGGRPGGGRHR